MSHGRFPRSKQLLLKSSGASLIVKVVYYLQFDGVIVGKIPSRKGAMSQLRQDWFLRFVMDLTV
jgi:hypothetical protein